MNRRFLLPQSPGLIHRTTGHSGPLFRAAFEDGSGRCRRERRRERPFPHRTSLSGGSKLKTSPEPHPRPIADFRTYAWHSGRVRLDGGGRTPKKRHHLPLRDASKVRHRVFQLALPSTPIGRLSRVDTMNYAFWQEEFHFLACLFFLLRRAKRRISIFSLPSRSPSRPA